MSTIFSTLHFNPQESPKLSETLQGAIYKVPLNNGKFGVVKLAIADLVKSKRSRKRDFVEEDFKKECQILSFLSSDETKPTTILSAICDWTISHPGTGRELCHCVLTEYIPGRELLSKGSEFWAQYGTNPGLVNYALWERDVRHIFQQIVFAVDWLHSKGVVHRDLSPENILVIEPNSTRENKRLQIKIIDFGLAARCDDNFVMTGKRGKMFYMPPEVFEKMEYDARLADVWSMGATLLFLLGGFYFRAPDENLVPEFRFAMQKGIVALLRWWKRDLMSETAMDVLSRILQRQFNRISMQDLVAHPYIVDGRNDGDVENEFDVGSLANHTFERSQLQLDDFALCGEIHDEQNQCKIQQSEERLVSNNPPQLM